jgi:hypothetical protein
MGGFSGWIQPLSWRGRWVIGKLRIALSLIALQVLGALAGFGA